MDDFGNDIERFSTESDYQQWLISTSAYGGFTDGAWSRSERVEV